MNYKLEKFGSTLLPQIEAVSDIGSGARISLLELAGGGYYDQNGTRQTEQEQTTITHQARLVGTSETALYAQFRALLALRGVSAKLYRLNPDGTREWCQARLLWVRGQTDPRRRYSLPVEISFAMISRSWYGYIHGPEWYFDAGYYFDTGMLFDASTGVTEELDGASEALTLINGGNKDITNPIIHIHAGSADITHIEIVITNMDTTEVSDLVYSGTIVAGKDLVIDCGALTVENDGAGDYAHLARGAAHTEDGWMKLFAGSNGAAVATAGVSATSTITFEFADGWN
jgi:hypothetical protein